MAQDTFSECWGRVWGGSCVFRLAYTPRSVPGCGLGNRATQVWPKTIGFSCCFLFRLTIPRHSEPGEIWAFWLLRLWRRIVQFLVFSLFGDTISPRPRSLRLWRYFGFSRFRRNILAPPPLAGNISVVFFDIFFCS